MADTDTLLIDPQTGLPIEPFEQPQSDLPWSESDYNSTPATPWQSPKETPYVLPEDLKQENVDAARSQQGTGMNILAGAVSPFRGIASGLENAAALAALPFSTSTADALHNAAQRTGNFQPAPESTAGQIAAVPGSIATAMIPGAGPVLAATNQGINTGQQIGEARAHGQDIGTGQAMADIAGQSALAYVVNRTSGQAMTGKFGAAITPELQNKVAQIAADLGVRAVIGGSLTVDQGAAADEISKLTGADPNADPLSHALMDATLGAAGDVVGRAAHLGLGGEQSAQKVGQATQALGGLIKGVVTSEEGGVRRPGGNPAGPPRPAAVSPPVPPKPPVPVSPPVPAEASEPILPPAAVPPEVPASPVTTEVLRPQSEQGPSGVLPGVGKELAGYTQKLGQLIPDVKQAWSSLNRVLGTGVGDSEVVQQTKGDWISKQGELDLRRIRAEQAAQPFIDRASTYSPEGRDQWIDQVEHGQPSPDPQMQPFVNLVKDWNGNLKSRAAAVGVDTRGWNPDNTWIGRLIDKDPSKPSPGPGTSLGGTPSYQWARHYDTFAEFRAAIEAAGYKLRYPNAAEMYLAKLHEADRDITAREFIQNAPAGVRVPEGQKPPAGYKPIDDKLGNDMGQRYSAPAELLGKVNDSSVPAAQRIAEFQRLRDSGQLNKLGFAPAKGPAVGEGGDLQSVQAQGHPFAEQSEWPQGHKLVDPLLSRAADRGKLYFPADIADSINQIVAPSNVPDIFNRVIGLKRLAVASNMALSMYHAITTARSNAMLQFAIAADRLTHGELSAAAKDALQAAIPGGAGYKGNRILRQAREAVAGSPLEPIVQEMAKAGFDFSTSSKLGEPRTFLGQLQESPIATSIKSTLGLPTREIMEHFVPPVKAGLMANYAKMLIDRGIEGPELTRQLQTYQKLVDNVAGEVVRRNQFQHRAIQAFSDALFTAPKFAEGALRFGAHTAADMAAVARDIAAGRVPTIRTPHMMAALGYIATTAIMSSLVQIMSTAMHGKVQLPRGQDFFFPRSGRLNPDGTEQRFVFGDPIGILPGMYREGVARTVENRVAAPLKAVDDVIRNADWRGVEVRSGNPLQQTLQSVGHLGASVLPWSIQQAAVRPSGQPDMTWRQKFAMFAGAGRFAPESYSRTPAENLAHTLLQTRTPAGPQTEQEADHAALLSHLANVLRPVPGTTNIPANGLAELRQNQSQLSPQDVKELNRRAREPAGLAGLVTSNDLKPEDLMQIWGAANDGERGQVVSIVADRIVKANIPLAEKRQYLSDLSGWLHSQQPKTITH
jgi:hypothetical protein